MIQCVPANSTNAIAGDLLQGFVKRKASFFAYRLFCAYHLPWPQGLQMGLVFSVRIPFLRFVLTPLRDVTGA